jgi:hypothetical protein
MCMCVCVCVLTDSTVLGHSVLKVILKIGFQHKLSFKRFHVGRKGRFGKRVLLFVSMSGNVPVVGLSLSALYTLT